MIRKEVICPVCGKQGFFSIYINEEGDRKRYKGMVYHRENVKIHYICQLTEQDYVDFNNGKTREVWLKALEKWALRQDLLKKGIKNLREVRWVKESVANNNKVNAN